MAVLPTCPQCGMDSLEIRCPRCNALKLIGCAGSCATCRTNSGCKVAIPEGQRPSDTAREDDEHPGTPLEG